MRPNSISLLITQLFDLVSNCNTGEAVRTDTKGPLKGDVFSLLSLNVGADL